MIDQRLAELVDAYETPGVRPRQPARGRHGLRRACGHHRDGLVLQAEGLHPTLRRDAETLVRAKPDAPLARLVSDGLSVDAIAIKPLIIRGAGYLVGVKGYPQAEMERLARLNGIRDAHLTFVRRSRARPSRWPTSPARPAPTSPGRPGQRDLLRQRLIPVLGFGLVVALLLLILLVLIRWLARDLAKSQEQARVLVGRDPLSSF